MKKISKLLSIAKTAKYILGFFAFVAIPLVVIISAIAIGAVLIIGVPFVLIALLIYYIISNNS